MATVATAPDTVQTVGVALANVTGKPELAVAVSGRIVPACCAGMAANVMVC
ncbi:MAG: hypothetical protein WAL45_01360 [Terracidiphilus sp.]